MATYGQPNGADLYRVGDTINVQQSDGPTRQAEVVAVDITPEHVRYCAKWGNGITQWDYFYGHDVNRWNAEKG